MSDTREWCWYWRHDWGKWGDPFEVSVIGESDRTVTMQVRTCKRCGKYQRKLRGDTS